MNSLLNLNEAIAMSNVTKCDQKLIVEAVGDVVVELEIKFLVCNSVSRTLIHFSFGLTQTLEPFFLVTMISVWRHCPEIGITSIFWMALLLMGEEVVRMQRHHCLGEAGNILNKMFNYDLSLWCSIIV